MLILRSQKKKEVMFTVMQTHDVLTQSLNHENLPLSTSKDGKTTNTCIYKCYASVNNLITAGISTIPASVKELTLYCQELDIVT